MLDQGISSPYLYGVMLQSGPAPIGHFQHCSRAGSFSPHNQMQLSADWCVFRPAVQMLP